MKLVHRFLFFIVPAVLLVASCQKVDLFEKNVSLKEHRWPSAVKPEISFTITDTTSLYNLFVVLRHTEAYRYNNLWLKIHTIAPGDSTGSPQSLDLQLASNEKGWLGVGMDDIYEHRIRITASAIPLKPGTYRFKLEQIMRDDPLLHILNVGIRVERALN